MEDWSNGILKFYELAQKEEAKMLMVGGGAVNLMDTSVIHPVFIFGLKPLKKTYKS
jgi:hypothetical protein